MFITNIEFSECISTFEMKIYSGKPVTGNVSESFREKLKVSVIDDIVIGNDTNRNSDYGDGGNTSRETRRMIID